MIIIFLHLFNLVSYLETLPTTNQLTFLYNTFCQTLDAGKEVQAVFCDISKALDRVWHAGLLHKLRSVGISGELLKCFSSYLGGRKQRVGLALRLPRLGKRELILVLFVLLFDLCLFGFVGFLFLLVSGKGCGL